MNNAQLMTNMHACTKAKRAMKGLTVSQAWTRCEFGAWMKWYAARLYRNKCLDADTCRAIYTAANRREPGTTPATRIRAVVPATVIVKATAKYRKLKEFNRLSIANFTLEELM